MELQVIGTGSSGNAYILSAGKHALLLDAGLPIRAILREVDWKALQGCLITHEHQDHAKAARELAGMGLRIYMTEGTLDAINGNGSLTALNAVQMLSPFDVGEFTVMALKRSMMPFSPADGSSGTSQQEKSLSMPPIHTISNTLSREWTTGLLSATTAMIL